MWTKPWTFKEGFLIGGGLIFAGLALELSVGPVNWDSFAWPANGIVLVGFLAIIAILFLLRKRVYAFQFVSTYQAAIPALVYAVVLTIIMGLTRQLKDGTWLNNMLYSGHSGSHHFTPADALEFMEARRAFPTESLGPLYSPYYRHAWQCRHATRKDDNHRWRA